MFIGKAISEYSTKLSSIKFNIEPKFLYHYSKLSNK